MSNPSLILPQSPAYGEDYVYAAQVEDGAVPLYNVLPLTFTRASGGTRINKDGLVQNMPYNLVEQSETFDSATWQKSGINVTANAVANPLNGQTTADNLVADTGNNFHYIFQALTYPTNVVTMYVYVKANGYNWFVIDTGITYSYYNISTGTLGTTGVGGTASIQSVGNGWYRCGLTFTGNPSSAGVYLSVRTANNGGSFTGDGVSGILTYGAQLNIGSTAQPYLATTDRLNMPRITYPVGGGCGALLLEKQSTNLVKYSEQFDNTGQWNPFTSGTGSVTITANYATSPDGTQNADRLQLNGGSGFAFVGADVTVTNGTIYTYSVWLKALSGTPNVAAIFDGATVQTATLTSEWVRYTFNFTGTGGATYPRVGVWQANWGTSLNADVLAWGAQLEASSYATSYIPTTSTSATRIADACYKTGISNLIGQTEGTIYGELQKVNGAESILAWLRTGATLYNEMIAIYIQSNGVGTVSVRSSATNQFAVTSSVLSSGSHKFALAYKANDFAFYIDGVQIATSSSGSVPTCDQLYLAGYPDGGIRTSITNEVILYKTRLTNAELATLTTL